MGPVLGFLHLYGLSMKINIHCPRCMRIAAKDRKDGRLFCGACGVWIDDVDEPCPPTKRRPVVKMDKNPDLLKSGVLRGTISIPMYPPDLFDLPVGWACEFLQAGPQKDIVQVLDDGTEIPVEWHEE